MQGESTDCEIYDISMQFTVSKEDKNNVFNNYFRSKMTSITFPDH